jgi:hypothetical protein
VYYYHGCFVFETITNYYYYYRTDIRNPNQRCGRAVITLLAGFMDDVLRAVQLQQCKMHLYTLFRYAQARCGGRDSCFILSRPPRRPADRENFFLYLSPTLTGHRSLRVLTICILQFYTTQQKHTM